MNRETHHPTLLNRRTWALVRRNMSFRQLSTQLHLARAVFLILISVQMMTFVANSSEMEAAGLNFFRGILVLNVIFVAFGSLSNFSSAIAGEKEQRTLGLLRMADVGPSAIIMGAVVPDFVELLVLVGVQLPFIVLAIALGGVLWSQIVQSYLVLAAIAAAVAGISIFASTVCARAIRANNLATLIGITLYVLPLIFSVMAPVAFTQPTASFVQRVCHPINEINPFVIMFRLIWGAIPDTQLWICIGANLAIGAAFFVLATLLLDRYANQESSAEPARGVLTRLRDWRTGSRSHRPWKQALVWKDMLFIAGGRNTLLVKALAYYLFPITVYFLVERSFGRMETEFIGGMYYGIGLIGLLIELQVAAVRFLRAEVDAQSLSTLLLLPQSTGAIIMRKFSGALFSLIPAASLIVVGTMINTEPINEMLVEPLATDPVESVIIGTFLASVTVLVPVWSCFLSLFIKGGAFFLGPFTVFITAMTCGGLSDYLITLTSAGDEAYLGVLMFGSLCITICIGAVCLGIIYRVQEVAAQS